MKKDRPIEQVSRDAPGKRGCAAAVKQTHLQSCVSVEVVPVENESVRCEPTCCKRTESSLWFDMRKVPYLVLQDGSSSRFRQLSLACRSSCSSICQSARSFFLKLLSAGVRTVCSTCCCRGCATCVEEVFSLVNGFTSLASSDHAQERSPLNPGLDVLRTGLSLHHQLSSSSMWLRRVRLARRLQSLH